MDASSSSNKGKGKGRRKIPLQKIQGRTNLEVTFSKRRPGLFKKASELSILCGCEVAIVIFTMLDKMFAFGSPSAEPTFNRFLQRLPEQGTVEQLVESECSEEIREISEGTIHFEELIRAAKKELQHMNEVLKNRDHNKYWWLKPAGELSLEEAKGALARLEDLEKKVKLETSVVKVEPPSTS